MRLRCLEDGHRFPRNLMLFGMKLVMRTSPPDVLRTLFYRPEFFGKTFSDIAQTALRESEHWSDGECELFAAFVSKQNQCPF